MSTIIVNYISITSQIKTALLITNLKNQESTNTSQDSSAQGTIHSYLVKNMIYKNP